MDKVSEGRNKTGERLASLGCELKCCVQSNLRARHGRDLGVKLPKRDHEVAHENRGYAASMMISRENQAWTSSEGDTRVMEYDEKTIRVRGRVGSSGSRVGGKLVM